MFPCDANASCKIQHVLELPVTFGPNGPIVVAKENGSTLHFLVVSETPISQIAPSAVESAGLKLGSHAPGDDMRDGNGRPLENTVQLPDLQIGQSVLPPITFLAEPVVAGVDGYIGYELLGLMDTEYDFTSNTIRLSKPISCSAGELAYWAKPNTISIAKMVPEAYPYLADLVIRVNGVEMTARISTKSLHNIIYRASAIRAGVSGAAGNDRQSFIKSLLIGTEETKDDAVTIIDSSADVDMLLGMDFLRAHRTIISRKARKMYFTRNN